MALLKLALSNFGMFDERCKLDLRTGSSRIALVCGSCASGKSTVVNAVSMLRSLVLNPLVAKTERLGTKPYIAKHPAHLELEVMSDDRMFFYTVEVCVNAIAKETLYFRNLRPRSKITLAYSRTTDAGKVNIRFGPALKLTKSEQNGIAGNTLPNNTVLGGYLKTNISAKLLDQAVAWFRKLVIIRQSDEAELIKSLAKDIKSNRIDAYALVSQLNRAGFTVKSLDVHGMSELLVRFTNGLLLSVSDISSGMLKYLLLCYALMKTADGGVLIVDDIDAFLTAELIELFMSEVCKSRKTVQLIATARLPYGKVSVTCLK